MLKEINLGKVLVKIRKKYQVNLKLDRHKNKGVLLVKRNNRAGQALVEFVIILPIFIFMILAVIDLGKILYFKNNLESKMDEVITSFETIKDSQEIQRRLQLDEDSIVLNIKSEQEFIEFELQRSTDIVTPGLNLIFGNPYNITTKRVVYNES